MTWSLLRGPPPEPSPVPISSPRLDLDDLPNSVRLVAPDVGILLVSSLCLCLCCRLVPKATAATRGRPPESPEPLERVSVTPVPPAASLLPRPASQSLGIQSRGTRGMLLGTRVLGWGCSPGGDFWL